MAYRYSHQNALFGVGRPGSESELTCPVNHNLNSGPQALTSDTAMEWNAARILWDGQVMLLWLLLPPIFLLAALLAVAAPVMFPDKGTRKSG